MVAAYVDDLIAKRFKSRQCPSGNVVHIGEIPLLGSISIDGDWTVLSNALNKAEDTHVRTPRRTIHSEIAKYRHVKIMQIVIGMSQDLSSFLRRSIGRKRRVCVYLLLKRTGILGALKTRG